VATRVKNNIITPLNATRYLAVIIDDKLEWRNYLQRLKSKIATRIGPLGYLSEVAIERKKGNGKFVCLIRKICITVCLPKTFHFVGKRTGQSTDSTKQSDKNSAQPIKLHVSRIYSQNKIICNITNKKSTTSAINDNDLIFKSNLESLMNQIIFKE
jgi:hypothetical protein